MDETSADNGISVLERPTRDRNGIITGALVSGEHYSPTIETFGTRSTGASLAPPSARVAIPTSLRSVAPRIKHRIYALFDTAVDNLDQANDNALDFILRNNCLSQVRDALADLWSLRSKCEEPFAEMVNMLQNVFAGKPVEEFTAPQIGALRSVLRELRDESVVDDEMANEMTTHLLKGGVDVFRELA